MSFASLLLFVHVAAQAPGISPALSSSSVGYLAVVGSASGGAADAERTAFDEAVRRGLALTGVAVQSQQNTADHLAEAKTMGIACEPAETACAARLGALAGVAAVVIVVPRPAAAPAAGAAAAAPNRAFDVELLLVDVARQGEVASVRTRGVPWDGAAQPDLDDAVVRLVAPDRWVGVVDVKAVEAGAEVRIDGVRVGTTPLPGPIPVAPGAHSVEVRAAGKAVVRQVTVKRAQRVVVLVDFVGADPAAAGGADHGADATSASDAPMSPLVWTGAAFLGAGLVVAGAAAGVAVASELALGAPQDRATRQTLVATAMVGTGVAVAAAATALAGAGVLVAGLLGVGGGDE